MNWKGSLDIPPLKGFYYERTRILFHEIHVIDGEIEMVTHKPKGKNIKIHLIPSMEYGLMLRAPEGKEEEIPKALEDFEEMKEENKEFTKEYWEAYEEKTNPEKLLNFNPEWLWDSEEKGWHHTFDYIEENIEDYEATFQGKNLEKLRKAIEKDFKEQGLDPNNLPEEQEEDEYYLDFQILYQLTKVAKKHGLQIEYLD